MSKNSEAKLRINNLIKVVFNNYIYNTYQKNLLFWPYSDFVCVGVEFYIYESKTPKIENLSHCRLIVYKYY